MRKTTQRLSAVAATAALAAGGALLAPSTAQAVPGQGSDHTRVVLKQSVASNFLARDIEAIGFGRTAVYLHKSSIAIHFNETGQRHGILRHNGGVVLKNDHGRVALRRLWINTNKHRVTAVVSGGDRLRVFTIKDPSHRPQLGRLRLNLTRKAARLLNTEFGTGFDRGDTLAYASAYGRNG